MKTSDKLLAALAGLIIGYFALLYGEMAFKGTREVRVKEIWKEVDVMDNDSYKHLKIINARSKIELERNRLHGISYRLNLHFVDSIEQVEHYIDGDTLVVDFSENKRFLPSKILIPKICRTIILENVNVDLDAYLFINKPITVRADSSKLNIGNFDYYSRRIKNLKVIASHSDVHINREKILQLDLELSHSSVSLDAEEIKKYSVQMDDESSVDGYDLDEAFVRIKS